MEYIKGNNEYFTSLLEFCHLYNTMIESEEIICKGSYYPRIINSKKRGYLAFKELYMEIKNKCNNEFKLEIPDVQEFIKTKNSVVNINQLYTTTKFINFLKEKDYEWEISNDPFPIENYEECIDKKDISRQIINYCKNSNYEKQDYIQLIKSFCSLI
jgi:hypothetical protein